MAGIPDLGQCIGATCMHSKAMNTAIAFDAPLLRRYDQPGPRYTSYPTAPAFAPDFGAAQLREQALRTNEEPIPRPLSIYVHVPYCFSPCFYCGCNRIITRDQSRAAPYLLRLAREIELMAPLVRPRPRSRCRCTWAAARRTS